MIMIASLQKIIKKKKLSIKSNLRTKKNKKKQKQIAMKLR